MMPLIVGALLALVAFVWVIAPIFSEESRDDAAEAAIRSWRERNT